MRSTPSMISNRIANMAIPRTIATTSTRSLLTDACHDRVTIAALAITIS